MNSDPTPHSLAYGYVLFAANGDNPVRKSRGIARRPIPQSLFGNLFAGTFMQDPVYDYLGSISVGRRAQVSGPYLGVLNSFWA